MYGSAVTVICLSFILIFLKKIESFDVDYYFLRSSYVDCDSDDFNFACSAKCKSKYTCLFGKCFCVMDGKKKSTEKLNLKHNNVLYSKDNDPEPSVEDFSAEYDYNDYYDRIGSSLRHHIAHFCENLDEARVCIRKCMQLGKPSFCGKDHVCYCGHKYPMSPLTDKKINADSVYSAFQDLYAKYFGTTERNMK